MNDGPTPYAVDDAAHPSITAEERIAELESRLKEAEQALVRCTGKLRQSLEVGKLGSWEHDLATGEVTADATCRAHLAVPGDKNLTFAQIEQLTHPDDLERLRQAISYALKTESDFSVECRAVRPDGLVARLLVRAGPSTTMAPRPA